MNNVTGVSVGRAVGILHAPGWPRGTFSSGVKTLIVVLSLDMGCLGFSSVSLQKMNFKVEIDPKISNFIKMHLIDTDCFYAGSTDFS